MACDRDFHWTGRAAFWFSRRFGQAVFWFWTRLSLVVIRADIWRPSENRFQNTLTSQPVMTGPSLDWGGIEKKGYELSDELGRGAYGCVRKAQKIGGSAGSHIYAIKRMDLNNGFDNVVRRWKKPLREVGILRRLRKCPHPGIIRIHEALFDGAGENLFMVFDHGGVSLDKYAKFLAEKGGTAVPEALCGVADCLTRQLCSGVAFLHSVSVIHRDLKPANILVFPCVQCDC